MISLCCFNLFAAVVMVVVMVFVFVFVVVVAVVASETGKNDAF